jgi:3-keto-disaccharide hydrolase
MAIALSFGKGRVFHTPLGHTWTGQAPTQATWRDPQLRLLLARGTEWAATGAVTLPAVPANVLADDERQAGFEPLFDGRTLDGWRSYRQDGPPQKGWAVRDGAIEHSAGGGGGDLITTGQFGDFDLRFQWRVASGANSGVIWHVLETESETYMTGPEYQVFDDLGAHIDPRHGAGALYDLAPNTGAPLRAAGRWNEGRIVVQDGRVQHWLNGVRLLDLPCRGAEWQAMVAASKFKDWPFGRADKGHIALQDHGDEVAYRSLRIKRL